MARTKKQLKVKEPIKIRFKSLANGNQSIYLDIYFQGERHYEFLKMYIVPEVNNESKAQNQTTLQCAEAIKAQRVKDLYNGEAGLKKSGFEKMLLLDLLNIYKDYKQKNKLSKALYTGIGNMILKMEGYRKTATLKEVDKAFCLGFIEYLRTAKSAKQTKDTEQETTISLRTARAYYKAFVSALNWAVKKGYMQSNPCDLVDRDEKIKAPESTREYLTREEVQKLAEAKCTNEMVKKAYLFACFCGLRYSDVSSLTWKEVEKEDGITKVKAVMQKTNTPIYVPLSNEALKWMPTRPEGAKDTDRVFVNLPSLTYINLVLKQFALGNGINKEVTFHTSRHTFATVLLQAGADLYTVKELLGHSDIRTTTIYAKIVNQAKVKAVQDLDKYFNNQETK